MANSKRCKSENLKLTMAEWRDAWAAIDRERAFNIPSCCLQHSKLLLATSSIIDECLTQGASFEQFLRTVATLRRLYEPDIQDAIASRLLDEIRDLLSKPKNKNKNPEPSIPDLASSLSQFSEKERLYLLRSHLELLRLSIEREHLHDRVRRQLAERSS